MASAPTDELEPNVPYDKLLDIGFLIFISHKLEELFLQVLGEVVIFCPLHLQYLTEKYGFWVELYNKYCKPDTEEGVKAAGQLIEKLLHRTDEEWATSIPDIHIRDRYREHQNIWDYSQATNSPPAGGAWIKRYNVNKFLDNLQITLGQLCTEILKCHQSLRKKNKNENLTLTHLSALTYPESAENWTTVVDEVNAQLKKLSTSQDPIYQPLFFISDLRNRISHHTMKRPCLFSGSYDRRRYTMKNFYKAFVDCDALMNLIGADEEKRADYKSVSEWAPLIKKYVQMVDKLTDEISAMAAENESTNGMKEDLKKVKAELESTLDCLNTKEQQFNTLSQNYDDLKQKLCTTCKALLPDDAKPFTLKLKEQAQVDTPEAERPIKPVEVSTDEDKGTKEAKNNAEPKKTKKSKRRRVWKKIELKNLPADMMIFKHK